MVLVVTVIHGTNVIMLEREIFELMLPTVEFTSTGIELEIGNQILGQKEILFLILQRR